MTEAGILIAVYLMIGFFVATLAVRGKGGWDAFYTEAQGRYAKASAEHFNEFIHGPRSCVVGIIAFVLTAVVIGWPLVLWRSAQRKRQ